MNMRWARWMMLVALLAGTANLAAAFTTDTLQVRSDKMNRNIPVVVLLPDGYQGAKTTFPVFYLLHGAHGNSKSWGQQTDIGALADQYKFITVCPDGGDTSWYFDSPDDPTYHYETFVASELVKFIDGHYRTRPDRAFRAIGGYSMGGHGALFLSIRHPDVFSVAIGFSGGYELRPFPNSWGIKKRIGTLETHPERWDELCVLNQAKKLRNKQLAISITCGVDDFFIKNNRKLHEQLVAARIDHIYAECPGEHDWIFWKENLPYQVMFMVKQFKAAEADLVVNATYDPTNGVMNHYGVIGYKN